MSLAKRLSILLSFKISDICFISLSVLFIYPTSSGLFTFLGLFLPITSVNLFVTPNNSLPFDGSLWLFVRF